MDFCQNCGEGIPEDPVEFDGWRLTREEAWRNGELLNFTIQEASAFHTIAAARPRIVSAIALLGRSSPTRIDELNDPNKFANVIICKIRKKLGANHPIKTIWAKGYRWQEKGND